MVAPGRVLDGKYRLEQKLGAGGMGAVHRASHLGTDRPVAVKLIAARFAEQPEFLERFRREARAAGRLRHPNVVDVTDFGIAEVDGSRVPYLVMELLDGRTLAEALAADPVPPVEWTSEVIEQVCAALDEAHGRGIVHRDLKPENLWLEPDRRGGFTVKVLDFGLAHVAGTEVVATTPRATGTPPAAVDDEAETVVRKAAGGSGSSASTLTRAGDLLGTPAYMSPQQWRGEALDARADIYALGVIAWRMLAGRPPFEGSLDAVRAGHLAGAPPLPDTVPPPLRALVAEAMAADPGQRPASAGAFAAAFRARSQSRADFLRDVVTFTAARWTQLLRVSVAAFALPLALALAGVVAGSFVTGPLAARWSRLAVPALLVSLTLAVGVLAVLAEGLLLHALVLPRRRVRLRELVAAFRPRAGAYLRVMAPYYAGFSIPALLLPLSRTAPKPVRLAVALLAFGFVVWVIRSLDTFWFAAQVVMSEGLEGTAARERSRALVRTMRRHLAPLEVMANGLVTACVAAVLVLGFLLSVALRRGMPEHALLAHAAGTLLAVALMALLMPMGTLAFGLLYFRTREAAGEPLPRILRGFEEKLGVEPTLTPTRSGAPTTPPHTAAR